MDNKKQLMALALCGMVSVAQAGEKEDLLKLRNTTTNLIKELVKQGILTEKIADEMIKKAEEEAEAQTAEQSAKNAGVAAEPGEIRVPYVPEFVKDEIRQQVRSELRADVVSDVMQQAKTQKWGMPEALPEWISRFKISGDLRLRSQNDFMSSDNAMFPSSNFQNVQAINQAGGVNAAGLNGFINTSEDRHRFRERLRLAIDADVAEGLKAGIRLATGNMPDPVSTNQTLGNTGSQYEFNLDRAFLKYDAVNEQGFKWLTVAGGRIANPWYVGGGEFTGGSELVWDTDLSFEGFAATYRYSLDSMSPQETRHHDDHQGAQVNRHSVFATVGAFPLEEFDVSSNDKWLFGGQVGVDWGFQNQDALKAAIAYYDYQNIEARVNTTDTHECFRNTVDNNASMPRYMQGGNTVAGICTEDATGQTFGMYGLAADYNIVNVNVAYDLAKFAPYHVIFSADYAKNVGFDSSDVRARRVLGLNPAVEDQTNAWQVRADVGWPKVDRFGKWNVFTLYKYVERDAVLDAYTDSDFHLGGTNAKGWVVGGNYGLMKNVWFTGRWLSTDAISGSNYGNDILQLDVNTRF